MNVHAKHTANHYFPKAYPLVIRALGAVKTRTISIECKQEGETLHPCYVFKTTLQ